MYHPSRGHLVGVPTEAQTDSQTTADTALRQLRHQTKNALQRIIAQVANTELRATAAGTALADDVERRIRLSARISDALFGLTELPGPLDVRLAALCHATVALLAHPKQTINVDVAVAGTCPDALQSIVVQIAHEMVGNAMKHGMHMRLAGQISIKLWAGGQGATEDTSVTLLVSDNGWGPRQARAGNGMPIMQALADEYGGTVTLTRDDGWTAARMTIVSLAGS